MISIGVRELRRQPPVMSAWLRRVGVSPPLPQGKRPLSEVVQERRGQERGDLGRALPGG
jgi:hypothetical protein